MKRTYRMIALSLLLVLLLCATAHADVIWEPENTFYQEHKKECMPYNRSHYINAAMGALGVYAEPNGKAVLGTLKNGTKTEIGYTYDNGTWGLISYFDIDGGKWVVAWIEMEHTVLVYDNQSFVEEYSEKFYDDTDYIGRTMLKDFQRDDKIYIYPYPGAEWPEPYDMKASFVLGYHYKFKHLFEDENGRIWGCLGEAEKGGGWMCLSDPVDPNLPVIEYQTLSLYLASDIEIQSELTPAWVLPTCLVVGVAAVSALLILVLRKKSGKESWNNTQPGIEKPKTMKGRMKSLQCTGWRGDDRDFEA